jgi:hypothetical protein
MLAVADAAVATLEIGSEAVSLRRVRLRLTALWIAAARRALGGQRHLLPSPRGSTATGSTLDRVRTAASICDVRTSQIHV